MKADTLLKKQEYDFLKTNPDLKNVIYLTLSGSRGYGTDNENSDVDLRGVLIEDKKYIFGLNSYEQFEDLPTDTVIYGLKKFVKLCVDANPNALELLGADEDCIMVITEKGKLLRQNADLFLSQRVVQSFGNYAKSQLKRLQNALCYDSYEEVEKTRHLQIALKSQIEHFKKEYTSFDNGAINVYINPDSGALAFDVQLNGYPIKDFVNIYSELSNIVKMYNKLNNRDNKKDDDRLYKHAMHLVRILITGIDILNSKGIITRRKDEYNLLMELRNGKYKFKEIFKITNDYQYEFEKAAKTTNLPCKPDMNKIEEFLISLY